MPGGPGQPEGGTTLPGGHCAGNGKASRRGAEGVLHFPACNAGEAGPGFPACLAGQAVRAAGRPLPAWRPPRPVSGRFVVKLRKRASMLPVLEGMEGSSLFREPLAAAGGPRRPRVGARPGVSLWGGRK